MWWVLLACHAPSEPGTEPTDVASTDVAPTGGPPTAETSSGHSGHSAAPVDPSTLPGNVLILVADDFGVEHVGAYHATTADIRTPVIDGLAASGRLFRNTWSYTVCSPARAALATGRHARRTGYGINWQTGAFPWSLPEEEVTLPELLVGSEWRWSTSYVGKWHLTSDNLPNQAGTPHRQGWGWFSGAMTATLGLAPVPSGPDGSYFWWRKVLDREMAVISTTYATTDTADDAVERLGAMREPWLMQVSFNAVHEPLHLPPAHLHTYDGLTSESSGLELGRAMAEAMDTEIGRILAAIEPDVRARTTIVFLGDNGTDEDLFEQPVPNAKGADPEANFSKGTLKDFGIRVPLIVSGPRVAQPGAPTEALASIVDIFATVAELAGVDPATLPAPIDGVSLLPVLADPAVIVQERIYSERVGPLGLLPEVTLDERVIRDARFRLQRDVIEGIDRFNEYVPGQVAEGPNLLPGGLTPEQWTAYFGLSAALDAKVAEMVAGG